MPSGELLWKKYENDVDVHRDYLSLLIKINIFYYAITGAIISFYFLHIKEEPLLKFSLLFPIIMSIGLVCFFVVSAFAARVSHMGIYNLAVALDFEVYSAIAKVLELLLWIFAVLKVMVVVGLTVMFFCEPYSISTEVVN